MTNAQILKEKILEDARIDANESISQAKKNAKNIITAAQDEGDRKRLEILNKAVNEAKLKKSRLTASAVMEVKKVKLTAKQEILNEVFQGALNNLNSLSTEEYSEILLSMVTDAVTKGNEEIILTERDRQRLGLKFIDDVNRRIISKGLPGNVRLAKSAGNFDGGFVLKDGDVEYNNTFSAMLRMKRSDLEQEVVSILFGSDGTS